MISRGINNLHNGPTNEWKFYRSRNLSTRATRKFSLLGRFWPRQPDRRSRNFSIFTKLRERQKLTNEWKFGALGIRSWRFEILLIERYIPRANSESGLGNRRIRGRSLNPLSYKSSFLERLQIFTGLWKSTRARARWIREALSEKKLRERIFFTRLWGHY